MMRVSKGPKTVAPVLERRDVVFEEGDVRVVRVGPLFVIERRWMIDGVGVWGPVAQAADVDVAVRSARMTSERE